jgi:DNA-binding FadR family transcriptional regulator
MGPLHLPKAGQLVASQIRREIVRRQLKEGDSLPPEAKLMQQFGISRPTLREALRMLEGEQLISVHRGARGGPRVRTPDHSAAARPAGLLLQINGVSLDDVLTAQRLLECGAVQLLASNPAKSRLAALRKDLDDEENALDDVETFSACAVRFHAGLIEATENQSLILLAGVLREIVERHIAMVAARQPRTPTHRPSWRTRSHAVHGEVLDLIAAGEAADAEDLWRRHLVASTRAMATQLPIKDVLDLFD